MSKESVRYGRMPRRSNSPDTASIKASTVVNAPQPQQNASKHPSSASLPTTPTTIVPGVNPLDPLTEAVMYRQPEDDMERSVFSIVVAVGRAHFSHCPFTEMRINMIAKTNYTLVSPIIS